MTAATDWVLVYARCVRGMDPAAGYTLAEVARVCGVSGAAVRYWASEKVGSDRLPSRAAGRNRVARGSDVIAFARRKAARVPGIVWPPPGL